MFDTLYNRLAKLVKEEVAKRRAESTQILRHCEPARAWQSISKNSKIVIEEITGLPCHFIPHNDCKAGLLRFACNDNCSARLRANGYDCKAGFLRRFTPANDEKLRKKIAFTLAEVLITIGIVGVVAAMVLPTINKKIQIMETEVNLKKTYSTIQQAVRRSVAEKGNLDVSNVESSGDIVGYLASEYLLPYLSGATLDKKTHPISYYGYKNGIRQVDGSINTPSTGALSLLRLNNGVNIFFSLINTSATYKGKTYYYNVAYSLRVDVNGSKGPNTIGKDLFEILIYVTDNEVSMAEYTYKTMNFDSNNNISGLADKKIYTRQELIDGCKQTGIQCGALIKMDGWKISKDYPIKF